VPGRLWTEHETKRARDLYAAGHFYGEIDKALGRRAGSTKRLEGLRRSVRTNRVPDNLLRDALSAAREQRALTQDFFGDSPPANLGADLKFAAAGLAAVAAI
jgi:outer membrane receptor protein involved in Fe transport